LPGEYIEWITEAKRGAARAQRLVTTIQWLAEGKPFTGNTQLLSFAVAGAVGVRRASAHVQAMRISWDRARAGTRTSTITQEHAMIRKLKSGEYRLYSRKLDPKTGRRRNLGTFSTRAAAEKHEREVQYFKRH